MLPIRGIVAALFVATLAPQAGMQDPVSSKARESVDKAVQWLLSAQNRDGSWGDNPGSQGEVGNTCIATLALMSTGSSATRGKHWRPIRRAVEWLQNRTRGYGESSAHLDSYTLLQRKLGQNIDLYLLTLLHSQVAGQGIDVFDDQQMLLELQAASDRIASLQQPNGAWETSYEPMLTTITAWLALRQAADAGVAIQHASPQKVLRYLKEDCLEPGTGIFREAKWGRSMRFVTQSGGLRVFYAMGEGETPEGQRATKVVTSMRFDQDVGGRSGGEEFLGALFATQALHMAEDSTVFDKWYDKITDSLVQCQNRDGSWFGHHCITGRVFCTACSIMTMLTPHKMLPMIER